MSRLSTAMLSMVSLERCSTSGRRNLYPAVLTSHMPGTRGPLWGWIMRPCFKLWSLVAVGLAFLAGPLRAEFVYVANAFSNSVSAYRIDPATGVLRPVAGSPLLGVI